MKPLRDALIPSALLFAAAAPQVAAQTLAESLAGDDRFDVFVNALRETGLDARIDGPATVFAPTDEAFQRMPVALRDRLGDPAAADILRRTVALHVFPGGAYASDNLPVEMDVLAEDARLVVTYTRGALTLRPAQPDDTPAAEAAMRARAVTEARVRVGDIRAGDVTVHGIDMVLLPPDLDDRLAALEAGEEDPSAATTDDRQAAVDEAGGDLDVVVIDPEPAETAIVTTTPDPEPVQEDDVFVYGPDSTPSAPAPAAVAPQPPADVAATLPEQPEQTGSAAAQPDRGEGAEGDRIDIVGELISVMDLVGQPVRDGEGAELGEVTDVLISLDGAEARTLVYAEGGGLLDTVGLSEAETVQVDMGRIAVSPVDGAVVVEGDAD
jgi:uncharacterized surface protein with fasciclin (FAS1) repeats